MFLFSANLKIFDFGKLVAVGQKPQLPRRDIPRCRGNIILLYPVLKNHQR